MKTLKQIKTEIMKQVNNQKRHDKASVGYIINAIEKDSTKGLFWDSYTRKELVLHFSQLLDNARCLNNLVGLVSFNMWKNDVDLLECCLKNKNGYTSFVGSYRECVEKKNNVHVAFSKNWAIEFTNNTINF